MSQLTLKIAAKAFFGTEVERMEIVSKYVDLNASLAAKRIRGLVKLPRGCPIPSHNKASRAIKLLDKFIYELIEEYRNQPPKQTNVLSRLMTSSEWGKDGMDPKTLRDEIVTIL